MASPLRLRAPATTANLGPGFDCLGLALGLYLHLEVREEKGAGLELRISGEGAHTLPRDQGNLICQSLLRALGQTGYTPGHLLLSSHSQIPLAAGLGSSAAARVAGLAAGLLLAGQEPDPDRLIALAVEEEGHPDNVAPCILGGFALAVRDQDRLSCLRLPTPAGLQALVVVPDFALPTPRAREVLPAQVDLADAVFNQSRTALLAAALALGRLELLKSAMQDRLHQPYRAPLIPGLEDVLKAALKAGALGASLSGAGPAVLALVRQGETHPGLAMQEAWQRHRISSRLLVLELDQQGLQVARGG